MEQHKKRKHESLEGSSKKRKHQNIYGFHNKEKKLRLENIKDNNKAPQAQGNGIKKKKKGINNAVHGQHEKQRNTEKVKKIAEDTKRNEERENEEREEEEEERPVIEREDDQEGEGGRKTGGAHKNVPDNLLLFQYYQVLLPSMYLLSPSSSL
jgi:hypothetical protein